MEIFRATCGGFHGCNFKLLPPFSVHHPPFRRSAPATDLILPTKPKLRHQKSTACALLEDKDSAKDANTDVSLLVKKRASDVSLDLKGTSLFLVGINSSVKSNLGKHLADALRYYYIDSDSVVEDSVGGKAAAASIIKTDKEGFQDSETEVLRQLSSMGRLLVSAGSGAVRCSTNLALLRHGISIWIDVPLKLVAREVVEDKVQLSAFELSMTGESYSEVLAQMASLLEERRSGYATADATVSLTKVASRLGYEDLCSVSTEELCLEVLKEISKLLRLKKMIEEAARPF
ncbi:unnamed protein product [Cuscuta epithymum]|uniref:Shikimate kinase n=1 Tax=Cuscuta epithymum TaxID=186058 RepID=A0AAV0DXQ9_9ASTE|nr:unnamed protein product [Cuscuta epithymum]